jgi:hypothetical protein
MTENMKTLKSLRSSRGQSAKQRKFGPMLSGNGPPPLNARKDGATKVRDYVQAHP